MERINQMSGSFWLSERRESIFSGTLYYKEGELYYFDINIPLRSDSTNWYKENLDLVIFKSTYGKLITFEDVSRLTIYGLSDVIIRYLPSRIFENYEFSHKKEIIFSKITTGFSGLNYWINQIPLEVSATGSCLIITAEESKVDINFGNANLSLYTYVRQQSENLISETKLTKKTSIILSGINKAENFDFYKIKLEQLSHFFTFATSSTILFGDIFGICKNSSREIPNEIKIIENESSMQEITEITSPYGMLFTFRDVKDSLQEKLDNWINLEREMNPVIDLFFLVLTNIHYSTETVFIYLSQFLETYHRIRFGGKYQPDEVYFTGLYKSFLSVIPDEIDGDFKQSLKKGKLFYANEFSLRKRLKEISFYLFDKQIDLNTTKSLLRGFSNDAANYRNILTHPSPSDSGHDIDESKLVKLTTFLRGLIEIILLIEIGFSTQEINSIIARNDLFRRRTNFASIFL